MPDDEYAPIKLRVLVDNLHSQLKGQEQFLGYGTMPDEVAFYLVTLAQWEVMQTVLDEYKIPQLADIVASLHSDSKEQEQFLLDWAHVAPSEAVAVVARWLDGITTGLPGIMANEVALMATRLRSMA